ncbi:MAG: hypothetical protein RMN24_12505 [Anaerolineae bacterium]|nr:hypothetical protein [Caldilineales bacterium]MDW8269975.1 hypothetical protein [Anaerolineae bacterium]
MRRLPLILAVVVLFVVTAVAAASGPSLTPFSTTGYTTNLVPAPPIPGFPPLIPSEFQLVPSGHVKFHISAQGGPAVDNDAVCQALYGFPCQMVCLGFTGRPCGTDGYFAGGSFQFEEWGVADPTTFAGANHGLMQVMTPVGTATMRFGGRAIPTLSGPIVQGSFQVLTTSPAYTPIKKEEGTYTGGAGYIFTVDYTPLSCPGGVCPDRCAAFGGPLKLQNKQLKWTLENEGEKKLTLSRLIVNWPEGNGALTEVRLGGKKLYDQPVGQPSVVPGVPGLFAVIDSGWLGSPADRQIGADKKAELRLEFANNGIGQAPADYTLLVEFAEGCVASFAAFP